MIDFRVNRGQRHGLTLIIAGHEVPGTELARRRKTGRRSESLGISAYHAALADVDLNIVAAMEDEGANHYFVARRRGVSAGSECG